MAVGSHISKESDFFCETCNEEVDRRHISAPEAKTKKCVVIETRHEVIRWTR